MIRDIPTPSELTLGAGDEIFLSVWQNDDLSRTLIVDSVGNIYVPLVGGLPAAGFTLSELRKEITLRLSKYIVNPIVDIHVSNFKSQKVHVLGEIKNPGTLPLNQKMFIWEAISQVGGFGADANKERVLLIRTIKGESKPYVVDLQTMLKDGELSQHMYLVNGDIIYVAPSIIADVERFMVRVGHIINPLLEMERGIILWPRLIDVLEGKESDGNVIITP